MLLLTMRAAALWCTCLGASERFGDSACEERQHVRNAGLQFHQGSTSSQVDERRALRSLLDSRQSRCGARVAASTPLEGLAKVLLSFNRPAAGVLPGRFGMRRSSTFTAGPGRDFAARSADGHLSRWHPNSVMRWNDEANTEPSGVEIGRRTALASGLASSTLWLVPQHTSADTSTTASTLTNILDATIALPAGARAAPISLRPQYGIETTDVFYPPWFFGRWRANSTLLSVAAPSGDDVFAPGRNGTEALRRARLEIGDALQYDVRWRKDARKQDVPNVVVDREFNVASISRASMGSNAVDNAQEDGPDHITMYLKPQGAPPGMLYIADLSVVSRHTDEADPTRPNYFACAETTRQLVSVVAGERAEKPGPRSPFVKEIETICTYELDPKNPNKMRGYQRTATFLVPDSTYTGDPKLLELAAAKLTSFNGRQVAIDVRVYEVTYDKRVA